LGLDEQEFGGFVRRMQSHFEANLQASGNALFTTDSGDDNSLFDLYLDSLPEHRQYHTCWCCKRFIVTYGSLVTLDARGVPSSAIWNAEDAPEFYVPAVEAMANMVRRSRVTGVFVSPLNLYGQPVTGEWTHFAITPPRAIQYNGVRLTASQVAAEKLEDYRNIQRALAEFTLPMLTEAMRILDADALYRTEKVIGPARWLRDLHVARDGLRGEAKNNVTWKAIASAPAGFCHPRSSMVGTLLEDIASGMDFAQVSKRFAAKMHPLQYQRPQAAPSAGNIAEAEKLVDKLGIAPSFERRFARLDEVEAIWKPTAPQAESKSGGMFSHLTPKGAAPAGNLTLPSKTMTWDKFLRTVLPTAQQIQFYCPSGNINYTALLTAVHTDSPPILQWDTPDRRNPVSWYVYHGGSRAEQWGMTGGTYVDVPAITLKPSQWGLNDLAHQGEAVVVLLAGAVDSRESGNALFPETLKSDLRAVRSVIERYSQTAKLSGRAEASACGVMLDKNGQWNARLRVLSSGSWSEYLVDRFD
jgi:hypothetical protein